MNTQEVTQLIILIRNIWPNFKATQNMVSVWEMFLGDVEPLRAVAVVKQYAEEGEAFPPQPGLIAKKCKEATKTVEMDSNEAFAVARDTCRLYRTNGSGSICPSKEWIQKAFQGHDALRDAVLGVGYERFFTTKPEDVSWLQRDFVRAYERAQQTRAETSRRLELSGTPIGTIADLVGMTRLKLVAGGAV